MRFRYITPLYGFDADLDHIGCPENAEQALLRMAEEMAGTQDIVAIYIPEGTNEAYQPGNMRGRVVGGVKILIMPADRTIRDFFIPISTELYGGRSDGRVVWSMLRLLMTAPISVVAWMIYMGQIAFSHTSGSSYKAHSGSRGVWQTRPCLTSKPYLV
jgi:hypothetical protein